MFRVSPPGLTMSPSPATRSVTVELSTASAQPAGQEPGHSLALTRQEAARPPAGGGRLGYAREVHRRRAASESRSTEVPHQKKKRPEAESRTRDLVSICTGHRDGARATGSLGPG